MAARSWHTEVPDEEDLYPSATKRGESSTLLSAIHPERATRPPTVRV
jgi:hypothetical protein